MRQAHFITGDDNLAQLGGGEPSGADQHDSRPGRVTFLSVLITDAPLTANVAGDKAGSHYYGRGHRSQVTGGAHRQIEI